MSRNTRVFSDLDLNFTVNDSTGDIYKRYDEEAIKSSIKNLIMTSHGERPFHSELGSPIRNLLFENYTPMLVLTLRRAIEYVIDNYEPRVIVLDVVIDPYEEENRVDIGILFKIKNTETTLAVAFTLDRTR
jgi:phage baseplate assembly protein W